MKHYRLVTKVLASILIGVLAIGCGKKTDEALLAEFNAKKTEAEKLIADATEGLKKLQAEHTEWMGKIDQADSTVQVGLHEKMHAHESMIPVVQAGVDSLKYYVAAKTTTDDEIKTATAGLNAHLAAVGANWKALWEAHTKAVAEVSAALAAAPTADAATEGTSTTTTRTETKTTTTRVDQSKHQPAKQTPGGTPKVPPANTQTPPADPTKHEPAKQTPGGTPKTPPPSGGTKK